MESTKGSSLPRQSWHHAYVCPLQVQRSPPISKYTWMDKHLWDEGAKKINERMQCQIIIHNNHVMPWTARALATRVRKRNQDLPTCLYILCAWKVRLPSEVNMPHCSSFPSTSCACFWPSVLPRLLRSRS